MKKLFAFTERGQKFLLKIEECMNVNIDSWIGGNTLHNAFCWLCFPANSTSHIAYEHSTVRISPCGNVGKSFKDNVKREFRWAKFKIDRRLGLVFNRVCFFIYRILKDPSILNGKQKMSGGFRQKHGTNLRSRQVYRILKNPGPLNGKKKCFRGF